MSRSVELQPGFKTKCLFFSCLCCERLSGLAGGLWSCSGISLSAQLPLMPQLIKGVTEAGAPRAVPLPASRAASLYGNETS